MFPIYLQALENITETLTCKLKAVSWLTIAYLEEFQFLQEEEWVTADMSNLWPSITKQLN